MTDFFEDAIRWAAVSASARTATTAGVAAPGAATVGAAATVTSSVGAAAASAAGTRWWRVVIASAARIISRTIVDVSHIAIRAGDSR